MNYLLEGPGGLPGAKLARTIETDLPMKVGNTLHVTGNLTVDGTISAAAETSTSQTITAASANAFAVGANGTTNPAFNVDTSATSVATGLNVAGAAAGSGVTVSALSSGSNESIAINPKGTGGISILGNGSALLSVGQNGATNPALTVDASTASSVTGIQIKSRQSGGGVNINGVGGASTETIYVTPKGNGAFNIQTTASLGFSVGPSSTTNPTLLVDPSTASAATGLKIKSAAAAGGLAVTTISSGTDESLTIAAKGAGTITFNPAVTATAGGAANDGIMFGSLGVGLFTGTGAPTFSAMNGSIYVDSNATTTTTRIYVNKSGAGTAGTTWTNLTTAA